MNKESFYQYLENPEELGSMSLGQLAELIEEFPFFQTAQLLYLKNLQNLENIKFNKQLKLTAAYMFDRRFLFEYLNKPGAAEPAEVVQEAAPVIFKSAEPVADVLELSESKTETQFERKPELEKVIEEPQGYESVFVSDLINIAEPDSEVESKDVPEPNPEPEIQTESKQDTYTEPEIESEGRRPVRIYKNQDIIGERSEEDLSTQTIDIDADKETAEENVKSERVDLSGEVPSPNVDSQLKSDTGIYEKSEYLSNIERFIPIADIEVLMFDFPTRSKEDLLEFEFEQEIPEYNPDTALSSKMTDSDYQSRMTSHSLIEQFLQSDPLQAKAKPIPEAPKKNTIIEKAENKQEPHRDFGAEGSKKDLLDAFLENQPRLPSPTDEKQSVQADISLESLQDDESFMTETLAKIYIRQGYYLKAIKTYEKLSLKYPEKSIYFATQIEKIKELINNQ